MMPKEYENPFHRSGHKKELIERIGRHIHEHIRDTAFWQYDNGEIDWGHVKFMTRKWEELTESEKDVNRNWAVRTMDSIFCGGEE